MKLDVSECWRKHHARLLLFRGTSMLSASVARWEVPLLLVLKKGAVRIQPVNTAFLLTMILVTANRTATTVQERDVTA